MSKRRDPASDVVEFFTTAPLDVAAAVLGIVRGIVAKREKKPAVVPRARPERVPAVDAKASGA